MNKNKEYTIEQLKEMVREVNGWDGSLEEYEYEEMEFLNYAFDVEPLELLRMAHFGDFNWNDDYFTVNAYGNLDSISENDFHSELIDNSKEIIMVYNELVESGEIENII